MDVTEIKKALDATTTEFKQLLETQSAEIKANGETSKQTVEAIAKAEARMEAIAGDLKSIDEKYQERIDDLEAKTKRIGTHGTSGKTAGQQFTESEAYKTLKSRGFRGDSAGVEIKDISGNVSTAGPLLTPFLRDQILQEPDQIVFVTQLLQNIPVNTDAVQIFREVDFTNNAGFQPLPSTAGGSADILAKKPQSHITYDSQNIPIETIAHYIIASRQILADVSRLEAQINSRLVYGLQLALDQQILYGSGVGQDFTGLMVDDQVTELDAPQDADAGPIDYVRRAITQAQEANYYNVNGVVMGPRDWEAIETAKGSDKRYVWVSVPDGGQARLWRVPVVVSNAMQAGDFILGDWRLGAALYTREGITVRTSESHADYFVRNGVAILAELRAALGVELPKAFVRGNFEASTAAPTTAATSA